MKYSFKIYAAAAAAFCLGFLPCVGFMTADFSGTSAEAVNALNPVTESSSPETEKQPVIVIDAGHGGFDGGARAADGTAEKNINLAIALNLAALAEEYRVDIIMTRDGDYGLYDENSSTKKREDLQNRKNIMEESGGDLAVSIHLNSYPQDTSVYGAQVFYASDDQKQLAEHVQASLEKNIPDGRERTALKKNDVLLLQHPPCPVILVECGFLSSPEEAEKLKTAEYQQLLAEAIWQGIDEILCFEKKEIIPVIDSTNKSEGTCA